MNIDHDQALTKYPKTVMIPCLGKSLPESGSMPRTVNIGDAKAQLSHLIARAEGGEDIVIARSGVPAARIVPINRPVAETIELLREERTRRPRVPAAEILSARVEGRR